MAKWKKGRGKLGLFDPLIGEWAANVDSPMGKFVCTRKFSQTLNGKYLQLNVLWDMKKPYEELALIGVDTEKTVCFWSFTNDGKQSTGYLADVTDVHPSAIGFEANMPSGLARMAYWPDEEDGFYWIVESKTKKGWNRFVEHHYQPIQQ